MEDSTTFQGKIVGRDFEFATLKQHLADAIPGSGSTVLISGEPGVGKTALASSSMANMS